MRPQAPAEIRRAEGGGVTRSSHQDPFTRQWTPPTPPATLHLSPPPCCLLHLPSLLSSPSDPSLSSQPLFTSSASALPDLHPPDLGRDSKVNNPQFDSIGRESVEGRMASGRLSPSTQTKGEDAEDCRIAPSVLFTAQWPRYSEGFFKNSDIKIYIYIYI